MIEPVSLFLFVFKGRYISAECGYLLTRVTEISENP